MVLLPNLDIFLLQHYADRLNANGIGAIQGCTEYRRLDPNAAGVSMIAFRCRITADADHGTIGPLFVLKNMITPRLITRPGLSALFLPLMKRALNLNWLCNVALSV